MATYRQILVDGAPVGMQGLDAVFQALHAEGVHPGDDGLHEKLVQRVGRDNYIPYGAREVYAAALSREYAAYLANLNNQDGSGKQRRRGVTTWRGYPREQIPWFPTLDATLCDGCGVCLRLCSTGALAPTEDDKVYVAEPTACVVGCSSCATVCKPGALIFPPRSMLDAYKPRRR
jgi:ferredoxin